MFKEAAQAPAACASQILSNEAAMREAGRLLRRLDPPFVATVARGSSDQAALFTKVLVETRARTPVLSHSPSIGSIYGRSSPKLRGVPVIAISQSGRSPDILAAARDAQAQGAVVIAILNDAASPLAAVADVVIPVHAGEETSVAATKSFIATLTAVAHLVSEWTGDGVLRRALERIGETLDAAWRTDWTAAVPVLHNASSLLVLGRGLTLPIAGEAALKLKETSGMHAEAFSSAEVAHGPMTLIRAGDPLLVFGPLDEARAGLEATIGEFTRRGVNVIASGHSQDLGDAALRLQIEQGVEPVVAAISAIQSFYRLANTLAIARGRDPDRPPSLSKVTHTL
jgi:glucosamine--fructose-6-phosphate aminotransferase (isomerizing)